MQVSFRFHSLRCSEIPVSPNICTKIRTWRFHRTEEVSNNFSVSWHMTHISMAISANQGRDTDHNSTKLVCDHPLTATHCNPLQPTETHCKALQDTATNCNTLQHTATHCILQRTAAQWNTLQHTATHFNTLQLTATYCNPLQPTATHCNTLQHTATHCNTL